LFYFTTALISLFYFVDIHNNAPPPILRRPSFAPPSLVLFAAQHRRFAVHCLVTIGLLLSASEDLSTSILLRSLYALCVAVCDFYHFSSYGGHTGFVFLYAACAVALPLSSRSSVLRLIVAHQLGSSGMHKLRIGGWQWLHASTMQATLKFLYTSPKPFKPHPLVEPPWMKQPWLIRFCLDRPNLLALLTVGGVCFELFVCVVCVCGGYHAMLVLAVLCTGFHLSTAPLMGILFPFSIPVYWLTALSSNSAANDLFPTTVLESVVVGAAVVLLSMSSVYSWEDWPLNGMVLFPWNKDQQEALYRYSGSTSAVQFMLAHSCDVGGGSGSGSGGSSRGDITASSINVVEMVSCLWPANFDPHFPLHKRALVSTKTISVQEVAQEIIQWLRATRRFIDNRPGEQQGRCFDYVCAVPPPTT